MIYRIVNRGGRLRLTNWTLAIILIPAIRAATGERKRMPPHRKRRIMARFARVWRHAAQRFNRHYAAKEAP